jgi:hypothetical protein
MTLEAFSTAAAQVRPLARVVSLHVLGEPLTHPEFPEILGVCSRLGLDVNLVTNGTLLDKFDPGVFKEKCLRQISFSLHALSALEPRIRVERLRRLTEFAALKPARLIVGFRLRGGAGDPFVKEASDFIFKAFSVRGERGEPGLAVTLRDKVYLNYGGLFDWQDRGPGKIKKSSLGLRHHFAVLSTGAVVPCCADHDGRLAIGNVNEMALSGILSGPAASVLRNSLTGHSAMPAYCLTCGFNAPG